jgi:hypothetical protein
MAGQEGGAPRDSFLAVDEAQVPGRHSLELLLDEREMRAGPAQ